MRLTDTCECGAAFNARGWASHVQALYAMWLNGHRNHRTDANFIELVEAGE